MRVRQTAFDEQVLAMFELIRIEDQDVRDCFLRVIHVRSRENQIATHERIKELN